MINRRRLLFVTSRFPFPPVSGERLRALNLVRSLSERYAVTVLAVDPRNAADIRSFATATSCDEVIVVEHSKVERVYGAMAALLRGLPLQVGYFRSRGLRELVRELAPEQDVVVFHLIRRGQDWSMASNVPRALDMCDALSENFRQTAMTGSWWSPWTWISAIEAPRAARFEKESLAKFDAISMCTRTDAARVGVPAEKLVVATQGVDLGAFAFVPPSQRTGCGIALVGKMDFYPNREAALWFAKDVLPSLPEPMFLKIVGECPPRLRAKFDGLPRVKTTGRVSSIAAACADCSVAVAPMRVATGIQNKVLEYFAMGVPSVISPSVAAGLLPESRGAALVADAAQEWTAAVHQLLRKGESAEVQAVAARRYVERNHSWQNIGRDYAEALERVIEMAEARNGSRQVRSA
jgi:glycosyltransferase involved in cell wall biosynthesis